MSTTCVFGARSRRQRLWARAQAQPALAVFLVALIVRVAVAVGSVIASPTPLVPDERQYVELASAVADGRGADAYYGEYGENLFRWTFAYSGLLAVVFEVVPPSRLPGGLVSALFGAATAAVTVIVARRVARPAWALSAGLIVALLPSQVVWSSTAIRESMVWVCLAAPALLVPAIGSWPRRRAVGAIVLGAVGLLTLGWLRDQALVAGAWALAVTGLLSPRPRRATRAVVALGVAVLVPLIAGLGPLGMAFVTEQAGSLGERRTGLSLNAESGFIDIAAAAEQTRDRSDVVRIGGRRLVVDESLGAHVRHLPRGFVAAVFRPLPWDRVDGVAFQLAKVENIAWFVLYAAALLALPVVWRRRDVLAYPFAVIVTVVAIASVTQGNVGTAFRHRGQILWALAMLAAVGAQELRDQLSER